MAAENIILFGFILLVIAIMIIMTGMIMSGNDKIKFAVGGFIGPLPFGFANDPKMMWVVIGISVVLALIFIFTIIRHIL